MSDILFHEKKPLNDTTLDITQSVLQGCLFEVSVFPKPGLVTPISTGSHNDMNYFTFMQSSSAIYPCFILSSLAGQQHTNSLPELLNRIRPYGVKFEARLLSSTNQINTQRGILFLGSILCAAMGYLSQRKTTYTADLISFVVAQMTQGICQRELTNLSKHDTETSGEILFEKYGLKGIRGEVESGLSTVIQFGLPALKNALDSNHSLNDSMLHCLISLMCYTQDSTIVWRSDLEMLKTLQNKAQSILDKGSLFTVEGSYELNELSKFCECNRLSPGGSADLLAISVAMYILIYGNINTVLS